MFYCCQIFTCIHIIYMNGYIVFHQSIQFLVFIILCNKKVTLIDFSYHVCSVAYDSQPSRLLCPWASAGRNTGVSCHALLKGIFLTQVSNLRLLHCRQSTSESLGKPSPYYSYTLYLENTIRSMKQKYQVNWFTERMLALFPKSIQNRVWQTLLLNAFCSHIKYEKMICILFSFFFF